MILRLIFLLCASVQFIDTATCPALSGGGSECVSHMMIAIDASSYLKDANTALQLINFVSDTLMPKWGYSSRRTQFSFALYGIKDQTNLTCKSYVTYGQSDPEIICSALANLKNAWNWGVLGSLLLQDLTTDIYNCTIKGETRVYDLVILFTANNNPTDITKSAWFSVQQATIVVNLGNGDYSSWIVSGAQTTVLCNGQTFDDTLANRIIQAQCGKINGSDQCNVVDTTVPTFSSQITGIPTVPDDQTSLCDCDISKSWNDIMILADSSSAMGLDRFHELQAFVQSALSQASIGQNEQFQTRVGVVSYSAQAKVIADLDKYPSTDDFLFDDWGFLNGDDTNILAAVDVAIDQLSSNKHRAKSRKVIILGASTYREGNYEFPTNQTLTFKRNFGVVIVIAYGDIHGIGTDVLRNVASPGFYIDATPGASPDFTKLKQMICDANCFCPGQQQDGYFPITRTAESWPSQGCYWDSSLTSIQPLVNRTCSQLFAAHGVTAMPDTITRQQGLIGGAPTNLTRPNFFIGLQRHPNGQWFWDDGTSYEGSTIQGTGDCAVLKQGSGLSTIITAVDCHEGYYYSCQTPPCTSKYYCQ